MAYEWSLDELRKMAGQDPTACPLGQEQEWLQQLGSAAMEARDRAEAGDFEGNFGGMINLRDRLARQARLMRRVATIRGRLDGS